MSLASAYAYAGVACVLTALAQLMLKTGAMRAHGRPMLLLWLNPLVLASYAVFFVVTLLNLKAFQVLPLKVLVILQSLVLVMVVLGSSVFFQERLSKNAVAGLGLVLAGVLIFNLSP